MNYYNKLCTTLCCAFAHQLRTGRDTISVLMFFRLYSRIYYCARLLRTGTHLVKEIAIKINNLSDQWIVTLHPPLAVFVLTCMHGVQPSL